MSYACIDAYLTSVKQALSAYKPLPSPGAPISNKLLRRHEHIKLQVDKKLKTIYSELSLQAGSFWGAGKGNVFSPTLFSLSPPKNEPVRMLQ